MHDALIFALCDIEAVLSYEITAGAPIGRRFPGFPSKRRQNDDNPFNIDVVTRPFPHNMEREMVADCEGLEVPPALCGRWHISG